MRAILINPETKEITETQVNEFKDIAPAIGCQWVEPLRFGMGYGMGYTLYVDEDGKLKENEFFTLKRYPSPLAGKGLIVRETYPEGKICDCDLPLEEVRSLINFTSLQIVGHKIETTEDTIELKHEFAPKKPK